MNKRLFIPLICIIILSSIVVLTYRTKDYNKLQTNSITSLDGNAVVIRSIVVLEGYEFDLTLRDGRRIHATLPISTPPEARMQVIRLLNNANNPKVLFIEHDKKNQIYTIDIEFDLGHDKTLLTHWLKEKNLAWYM